MSSMMREPVRPSSSTEHTNIIVSNKETVFLVILSLCDYYPVVSCSGTMDLIKEVQVVENREACIVLCICIHDKYYCYKDSNYFVKKKFTISVKTRLFYQWAYRRTLFISHSTTQFN